MKTQLALTSVMLVPCLLYALVSQAGTLGFADLGEVLASSAVSQESGEDDASDPTDVYQDSADVPLWQRSSLSRIESPRPTDELDRCCGTYQHPELGRVEIERSGSNDLAFTYGDRVILFHLVANGSSKSDLDRDFASTDENPYRIRFRGSPSEAGTTAWRFSQLKLDVPVCEKMLTFRRSPSLPEAMSGQRQPLAATNPVQ
ncbi:MAG: hypothetical protein AAGG44_10000 [Planctomycetota bacterium]